MQSIEFARTGERFFRSWTTIQGQVVIPCPPKIDLASNLLVFLMILRDATKACLFSGSRHDASAKARLLSELIA